MRFDEWFALVVPTIIVVVATARVIAKMVHILAWLLTPRESRSLAVLPTDGVTQRIVLTMPSEPERLTYCDACMAERVSAHRRYAPDAPMATTRVRPLPPYVAPSITPRSAMPSAARWEMDRALALAELDEDLPTLDAVSQTEAGPPL